MSLTRVKVPTIVSFGAVGLSIGLGVVVVGLAVLRDPPRNATPGAVRPEGALPDGGRSAGGGGVRPAAPPPGTRRETPPPGTRRAVGGKRDLLNLVAKLDEVAQKPKALELTGEQKDALAEQLKGLGEMKELTNNEAEQRLTKILEALKGHRETLEAAGYRWPGGGSAEEPMGDQPPDAPNPFADGKGAEHLKSLQDALTRAAGGGK